MGDTGPATIAKSSGNTLVAPSGAAESAAIEAELAIVIHAWSMIAAHSRSIIVGIARNASNRNQSK